MPRPSIVIPSVRDLLRACYELVGSVLVQAFLTDQRRPGSGGKLAVLALFFLVVVPVAGLFTADYRMLAVGVVPVTIVYLHATDIARMRQRLELLVVSPQSSLPEISVDQQHRSPTVSALYCVTKAWHLAVGGNSFEAQSVACEVDRAWLDRRSSQLLDGAWALACLGVGDLERAASLAIVSVPLGVESVDRELGRAILRAGWHKAERLEAVANAWQNSTAAGLGDLAELAQVRAASLRGHSPQGRSFDPTRLVRLAQEARVVGDETLAETLRMLVVSSGPYR